MSRTKKIKVKVPAVIGNLSVGFDILGLAVDGFYDELIIELNETNDVRIKSIHGYKNIPKEPNQNTSTVGIMALQRHLKELRGAEIDLYKGIPIEKGLASSASSAVAGVFAYNHLLGNPLSKRDLIPFALEGERVSIPRATNLDNVAPAMLGGCILSSPDGKKVNRIFVPNGLKAVICIPEMLVNTHFSRQSLPQEVSLEIYKLQQYRIASFILGMTTSNFDLIRNSLVDDVIEPSRGKSINSFSEVRRLALDAGAMGCGISGSGPTLFALCENDKIGNIVAKKMKAAFRKNDVQSESYVCDVDLEGAQIL